jgi:hypothetical protein
MPAPRRSAPRRTAPVASGLLEKATAPASSGTIYNDTTLIEQPMIIRSPGNPIGTTNRDLMKFSQLIMMGIALAAIWGGLFSIAFAEDASNEDGLRLRVKRTIMFSLKFKITCWVSVFSLQPLEPCGALVG